jgi:NDP-sugar pyrophosphorylase family protein
MMNNPRNLRAFVLCGGLGTRLRPILTDRPKSMALVAGIPFLELLLKQLRGKGIRQVVLGTGYMAEQIESYFRDGSGLDLQIQYSREEKPLGTGGALKLAEGLLSDPVLVLNGDSYVDWSLTGMCKLLEEKKAQAVMVLHEVPELSRYGSVTIDSEGRVLEFSEKGNRAGAGWINAGVYLMRRELVAALPAGKPISLEKDVFPGLLGGKVYGLASEGRFIDIGIPADLERAQIVLASEASDGRD